jgi:SAM-dependent methyltransferase
MLDLRARVADVALQWDDYYRDPAPTPWEMIDFQDLPSFLRSSELPLDRLKSMVSVGCGRGRRDLEMLRSIDDFNKPSFSYLGVDISGVGFAQAKQLFESAACRDGPQAAKEPPLRCRWEFINADIFTFDPGRTFDVVLDWMCLHDIGRERIHDYAAKVMAMADDLLILKTFSQEGSTIERLNGLSPIIQKEKLSEDDVRALFGEQFEILFIQQFEEDLDPNPRPSDGVVAAKRAYVLRRVRAAAGRAVDGVSHAEKHKQRDTNNEVAKTI